MRKVAKLLLALALGLLPGQAFAAGPTTITILDGGGTSRTVNVNSSTGLATGNLSWINTVCDFTTLTQCATVTASNALKVDGSAVTQPISGTVSATQSGTWTVQPGNTANTTPWLATINQGGTSATVGTYGTAPGAVGALNVNANVTNANANGQATMANSSPVALASNQSVGDPCMFQAKTNVAIATAVGNTQLVAPVAAKKVYICSISLIAAATAVVNVIEGTGAACTTTNEAAVVGSTTAANGMSLAANGGLTLGNGQGTVAQTATTANGICLLQSGTTALAGNITYVQQ